MEKDKTKITINSYNKCATDFEAKFINFAPYTQKIIQFHEKYLNNKTTILDAGCGPGNNSKLLLQLNPDYKITCIDMSEKMIELAKINAPGCKFINADIRNIEIENKYDAVLASFCIVHLLKTETEQFISKISRILNDSGVLYISFMEGKPIGFKKASFSNSEIYFHYYKKEEIEYLLGKYQLNILDVTEDLYKEEDGSVTNEVFIVARKTGKNIMPTKFIKTFFKLPVTDKVIIIESVIFLFITRIIIICFPYSLLKLMFGKPKKQSFLVINGNLKTIKKISFWIWRISPLLPWKCNCLPQAITGRIMLKRRKINSTLYLGMSKGKNKKLIAHAWLKVGNIPVTGGKNNSEFSEVAYFG